MATDQVRIESLYEGLYRNVILFGLLIAAAWLFAAFSYYDDRRRLVCAVGRGHGLGRGGSHLQAHPLLPAGARDGAQRRPRIGAQRNRAWPQAAHILCAPFVLRLSDRHHRHRNLGLWGPAGPTDILSASRDFERSHVAAGSRCRLGAAKRTQCAFLSFSPFAPTANVRWLFRSPATAKFMHCLCIPTSRTNLLRICPIMVSFRLEPTRRPKHAAASRSFVLSVTPDRLTLVISSRCQLNVDRLPQCGPLSNPPQRRV